MPLSFPALIPVIAALAGALVGGLVGELRSLLQDRRERHRALRRLLSILLELRHQLRKQDADTLHRDLMDLMKARFPEPLSAQAATIFTPQFVRALIALLPPDDSLTSLGNHFGDAVEQISPHDPWLAHRLRGKASVLSLEANASRYFGSAQQMIAGNIVLPPEFADTQIATLAALVDGARKDLDQAVRATAFALSMGDWLHALWHLHRRGTSNAASGRDFNRLMDKVMPAGLS